MGSSKDLNSSTVISSYWGNPNLADVPPSYRDDGSVWNNGYRGVWHLNSFEGFDVLTDSSVFRNHAYDEFGLGESGVVGAGRSLAGGVEKYSYVCPPLFQWMIFRRKALLFNLDQAGRGSSCKS